MYKDIDGILCSYTAFIWAGFVHMYWKLQKHKGQVAYHQNNRQLLVHLGYPWL